MMDDNEDFLIEIQDEFLDETVGFLEQTENNFLQLESNPHDQGILENILRLAHNIKGSAAAVGFDGLSHFAHTFENLLVKIKQKEIDPAPHVIDVLLASNDMLKQYVDELRADKSNQPDTSEIVDRIEEILSGKVASSESAPSEDDMFMPEGEAPSNSEDPLLKSLDEEVPVQKKAEVPTQKVASAPANTKVDYDALESILMEEALSNVQQEQAAPIAKPVETKVEKVQPAPSPAPAPAASAKPAVQVAEVRDIKKPVSAPTLSVVQDIPEAEDVQEISKTGKASKKSDEFIRLPLHKIEDLLNDLSEQVILQSTLDHFRQDIITNADDVNRTIMQLGKITNELQQTAISLRMLSLRGVFSKMQRTVRDTAKILGKDIRFITDGDDTELDKTIIDELSSPLTHVIRNSVDHGIETPEERVKAGKPKVGTVKMSASYSGRYFYLEIEDDGKGLDRDKIRQKAIEKNLISPDDNLTEQQILNLIFLNSFSTKDEATDISGRGVGMDAIKGAIEKLRGTIDLKSEVGKGTKITIKLPPTLAIFNGIVTQTADRKFIFPSSDVYEIFHIDINEAREISPGKKIIRIRDTVYPIIEVDKVFNLPRNKSDEKSKNVLLTIKNSDKSYGVLVDDIIAQQRIVFKNLGKELDGLMGMAGGTILADGRVALIVEISDLVSLHEK